MRPDKYAFASCAWRTIVAIVDSDGACFSLVCCGYVSVVLRELVEGEPPRKARMKVAMRKTPSSLLKKLSSVGFSEVIPGWRRYEMIRSPNTAPLTTMRSCAMQTRRHGQDDTWWKMAACSKREEMSIANIERPCQTLAPYEMNHTPH